MEPKTLINADYLDIIFDNRNKKYGGYELRRNYNRRVKKALGFVTLGFAALFSFSFITVHHKPVDTTPRVTPTIITDIIPVVPPVVPPKVIPPVPPPVQHLNTKLFTPPKIIEDIDVPDDKQLAQNKNLRNAQPGFENASGDSFDIIPVATTRKGTGVVSGAASNLATTVRWVEQMPQFRGDMNAYISSHIHYPELARDERIAGQVMIEFVVNEDGSVSNVKVARGIGGGCDEEAARIVSGMPAWKPGKQNGTPVKVLFTLPIRFVLN